MHPAAAWQQRRVHPAGAWQEPCTIYHSKAHAPESDDLEANFIRAVEAWIAREEDEGRRASGSTFGFAHKAPEPNILAAIFAREVEAWIFKEEAEGRRSSGCRFGFADQHHANAECTSWALETSSISASLADVASTASATRCQVVIPIPAASTAASTTDGDCSVSSRDCAGSSAMHGHRCSLDSNCCANPESVSQDAPAATASAAAAGLPSPAEPNAGLLEIALNNWEPPWRSQLQALRRSAKLWVHFVWYKRHREFDIGPLLIGDLQHNLKTAVGKTGAKLRIRGERRKDPYSILLTATSDCGDDFEQAVLMTFDRLGYVAERYNLFCSQMNLPPPTEKQPCFSLDAYSRNAEVILEDLLALRLPTHFAQIPEIVTAGTVARISSDGPAWRLRKSLRNRTADSWAALRLSDAACQVPLATAVSDQVLINMFYSQGHTGVIPHIWIGHPCVQFEGLEPHMSCCCSPLVWYNGCSFPAFSNHCSAGSRVQYDSCGTHMFNMSYCGGEAGHKVDYNMLGACLLSCPASYGNGQYSFHCVSPVQISEDRHEVSDMLCSNASAVSSGCCKCSSASKWLNAISAVQATLQNVDDSCNISTVSALDDTPNLEDLLGADVCDFIYGGSRALQ